MKGFLEACVTTLLAVGLLAGCGNTNNSIQYATGATITALSPSGVLYGSSDFTISVSASAANGFSSNSVIEWNGQKFPACTTTTPAAGSNCTLTISTTVLTAYVSSSYVTKAGTAYINVYAPQSGTGENGLSNALAFLIYGQPNPLPSLSAISPASTPVCTTNCKNLPIKLTGTNFLPSSANGASTVVFTGLATGNIPTGIQVTSISSTQISAVVPSSYLAQNDTAKIDVINPPSGICLLSCPDLGGGTTGPSTPSIVGSNTTQTLVIGSGAAPSSATADATAAEETPALSHDGRYVVFTSPQNGTTQILMRDTCIGVEKGCSPSTSTISVDDAGEEGNADSHTPVVSADARFVAFSSTATNLVTSTEEGSQIYLRDTCLGAPAGCKPTTTLVSTDPNGALVGTEAILPSISSSGRYVAFVAITPDHTASDRKPAAATTGPNSGLRQVFLRDTCFGESDCVPKTTRISSQPGDAPANSTRPSGPALSGEAKQIALADGKNSTAYTQTVPVEQQVFVALPAEPK